MTNEIFEPVGLLEITKQLKTSRNKLDDLTERMQTALDAKRDAASAMSDELQEVMKRNQAMWQSGYDEGFKAGRDSEMQASEKRDRDLLEEHGIDVDGFCDKMVKKIQDYDDIDCHPDYDAKTDSIKDQDVDEDEPDQYPPEKWGGTK